ncbi:unnamed protein product [Echinostoma caproni]|uniref:SH3_12 domain-containing protein n=1 Tax=Echinostoma caproni TaxID=27848 RepID=A0A183AQC2_9TREM|nr:unnamed protein product [Echinostoma caproni]
MPSKLESMVLVIDRPTRLASFGPLENLARRMLGRPTSVRWPHSAIVMPVRLMTESEMWELEDFNISPILSTQPPPLRYRKLAQPTDCETGENNGNNTTNREVTWVRDRIEEREKHLSTRWAIVFNKDTKPDTELCQPVLLLSRKLDGWTIRRRPSSNGKNLFRLLPIFAESKAANGDQLCLTVPEPGSSWFRPSMRSDSGHASKKRSSVPALRTEPAHGLCDDLTLDLLDLSLEHDIPMPSFNHIMLSRNSCPAFNLSSLFHPGQVVISLALQTHGNTGEDASRLCSLPTTAMAAQLRLPYVAVARLTGTVLVTVSKCLENSTSEDPVDKTENTKRDDKPRNGKKSQQVWNVGFNLRRNKSRAQVLGWSRFCPVLSKWLFSKRTLALLNDYHKRYPKLWELVVNDCPPSSGPITVDMTSEELNSVVEFLEQSGCRNAQLATSSGRYVDDDHVKKLRDLLFPSTHAEGESKTNVDSEKLRLTHRFSPLDRAQWSSLPAVQCTPVSLFMVSARLFAYSDSSTAHFIPVNTTRNLYPSGELLLNDGGKVKFGSAVLKSFGLMDRVVFCKNGQTIPMGLFGTVIGIPSDGTERVEVMFDKEFDGATDIRGSGPCSAVVHSSLLIKLPVQSPMPSLNGKREPNLVSGTTVNVCSRADELKELNALFSLVINNPSDAVDFQQNQTDQTNSSAEISVVNNEKSPEPASDVKLNSDPFLCDITSSPPQPPLPPASWSSRSTPKVAKAKTNSKLKKNRMMMTPQSSEIPPNHRNATIPVVPDSISGPRWLPPHPAMSQPRSAGPYNTFPMRHPCLPYFGSNMSQPNNFNNINGAQFLPGPHNPAPYYAQPMPVYARMPVAQEWPSSGSRMQFFNRMPGIPPAPPQEMFTSPTYHPPRRAPMVPLQQGFYRDPYYELYYGQLRHQYRPPY